VRPCPGAARWSALEIAKDSAANGDAIAFSGKGTLKLDSSEDFSGTIAGFTQRDRLDLADIGFGPKSTVRFSEAANDQSGTLSVSDDLHTANLNLLGQYAAAGFTSKSDGNGGMLIGSTPKAEMISVDPIATPHHA
jgi:hypothetical protein